MTETNNNNSFLSAVMAFLNRDIFSFFKGARTSKIALEAINTHQLPLADSFSPLLAELDVKQLEQIRYRREILDWRDESIVKLSLTGSDVLKEFSTQMNDVLNSVSIWRRIKAQTANEVLRDMFDNSVRSKIRDQALHARVLLINIIAKQCYEKTDISELIDNWPDKELVCIEKYGFKLSKQNQILSALELLVTDEKGIVKMFQDQIIEMSKNLLKEQLQ